MYAAMKTDRHSPWTAEQHRRYAETFLLRLPAIILSVAVLIAACRGSEVGAVASGAAAAIQNCWSRLTLGK